jgi:uncharacterized membrane protein YphA (DoxX/SURF4 family)
MYVTNKMKITDVLCLSGNLHDIGALRDPDAFVFVNINDVMKKVFPTAQILLRFALGVGFLLPVLDRIGFLGAPGSADVSWGNWNNFVGYANSLMPYFSPKTASLFGVIATIAEASLGILLIIGYQVKLAAYGSFILTLAFALSMLFFVGYRSPFDYSVFVVSFSSLLLASLQNKETRKHE